MKTVNYTAEQTQELVAAYTATPTAETIEVLAAQFGKTARSVIAKLAQAGVYVAKRAEAKEKADTKADLVKKIAADLNIDPAKLETLEKASKEALQLLANSVNAD